MEDWQRRSALEHSHMSSSESAATSNTEPPAVLAQGPKPRSWSLSMLEIATCNRCGKTSVAPRGMKERVPEEMEQPISIKEVKENVGCEYARTGECNRKALCKSCHCLCVQGDGATTRRHKTKLTSRHKTPNIEMSRNLSSNDRLRRALDRTRIPPRRKTFTRSKANLQFFTEEYVQDRQLKWQEVTAIPRERRIKIISEILRSLQ